MDVFPTIKQPVKLVWIFNLSSFLPGLAFLVYPAEVSEVSRIWSDIKNKINNKCRYQKKTNVTHLSSADSMVEV